MDKPAPVDHPVHDLIRGRWSPRAFDPERPVTEDQLRSLLEAARWAPSCYNDQPWRFVVARREDSEDFARMMGCLASGNQVWARHAAVLLLAVAASDFRHNGKPNRWAHYDTGQAVAVLTVQASALGLRVHQMGGFSQDKAARELGVPADHTAMAAIAVGHPGAPEALPEDVRASELSPRKREPLAGLVFEGRWGERPRLL